MDGVKEDEKIDGPAGWAVVGTDTSNPGRLKHFTARQALHWLSAQCLDESYCRNMVLNSLHPYRAFCPQCGIAITDDVTLKNFWSGCRCKCKACGKWFTAYKGTMLEEAHLTEREVFLLAILIELNLHKNEIARVLGINPATVHNWKKKFKALDEIHKQG